MWNHLNRSDEWPRTAIVRVAKQNLPLSVVLVALAVYVMGVQPGSAWGQVPAGDTVLAGSPTAAASSTTMDTAPAPRSTGPAEGRRLSVAGTITTLRQGGVMLLPLGVCSFLLFVFAFERAISLRRGRVIPRPFVRRFIHQNQEGQLDRREALARCREDRSPVAEVFAAGVIKWDRPSVEVEQAILDGGERVANSLRRYLRLFNGIATISPLLGLLGTVLGMIRAFNAIASADAMGKPELLANGISQALLTTAAGLTVAIPAYVAHLFFSSRVDRLVMDIDHLGQKVVNGVACDGFREKPTRKKRARAA